jgi:PAS domain S-box-containing protein
MAIDLEGLLDALPGLVWTIRDDGVTGFVNRRWRDYTGLEAEHRGWHAVIHPDDLSAILKSWDAIRTTGVARELEARLRRSDGEYRWFVFRLSRLSGEGWCWLGLDADETSAAPDGRRRRFIDMLPAQIVFMTPDLELELVNREVLEFYGKSLEELQRWNTPGEVTHSDDLPEIRERLVRLRTLGEPWDNQSRMLRADGVWRWVRSRMVPSKDAQGNVVRYCSVQTDVHELKQAEDILAGEVRLLEMVALGRPLPEVLDALSLLVEEIAFGCLCRIAAKSYDGKAIDPAYGLCWSTPIVSSSGEESGSFSVYRRDPVNPAAAEQKLFDRFIQIAGIAIERARSDEALRTSEAGLRAAHRHLNQAQHLTQTGSFTTDLETDHRVWSDELYRIFEVEPGTRVTFVMFRGLVHPGDLAAFDAAFARALTERADFDQVFRVVTPKGTAKQVHAVWQVVEGTPDHPIIMGSIQNVTESKQAEVERVLSAEALNRARMELAHISRVTALSTLTASIAHEVNQPLAGIVTNGSACLRMLAAQPPDTEGARATAQRTIRDANRASEVIKRLRAMFARRPPSAEPVDLNDAIREVLALTSGELRGARVLLQTRLADALPAILGDRIQLQQVILNLVLNAVDAMRAVDDRPHDLQISTARDGHGQILLRVRDSGTGAPADQLEQIFDAFYTTKPEGMGVGLSISRSIVETQGGLLWASLNEGPGLTFSVSIPIDTIVQ